MALAAIGDRYSIRRIKNAVAAGNTVIDDCTTIDMANANGCFFLVALGDILEAGVGSIAVQDSDDDGDADTYSNLDLDTLTVEWDDADSNKIVWLEVLYPKKRWLKLVINRSIGDTEIDGAFAMVTGVGALPASHGDTVLYGGVVRSPDRAL